MKNDKKQLCKTCKYAGKISVVLLENKSDPNAVYYCDYSGHTGHCRSFICDAEDCTVYAPKKRKRKTVWGFKKRT